MAQTVHESLSKLTDADVHAMIAYLKSTPAKPSYTSAERTAYTGPQPVGREIYLNNCASCHQLDGKGIAGSVPSLVANGSVLADGPQDVIRVLLGGIEAQASYAPMPAVAADLTDGQVATVANYVRQAWGNQAPPNANGPEGRFDDQGGRTACAAGGHREQHDARVLPDCQGRPQGSGKPQGVGTR